MSLGDIYKLSIVGRFGLGQQFVCTMHYRQEQILVGPPEQGLAEAFRDGPLANFFPLIMDSTVVDTIEVRQITGDTLYGYDLPVGDTGELTGDQLPPQVCALISWRTGMLGRRNRGRMYLPAPNEAANLAGQLGTLYAADVQTFADSCHQLDVLTVLTWQQVIYGAPNPDADPPLAENIAEVTSAIVRGDYATQRRRRVGTGI